MPSVQLPLPLILPLDFFIMYYITMVSYLTIKELLEARVSIDEGRNFVVDI
jgi:hypothetical protein